MKTPQSRSSIVAPLARRLKAVSDETRVRILSLLSTGGPLCVCEFSTVLHVPHYSISRHLNILKRARLLESRRERTYVFYSLGKDSEGGFMDAILRYLATANGRDRVLRQDASRLEKIVQLRKHQDRLTAYCERVEPLVKRSD